MPMKEKVKMADYVIDNSNSLDKTKEQVEIIWRGLVSRISWIVSRKESRSQYSEYSIANKA